MYDGVAAMTNRVGNGIRYYEQYTVASSGSSLFYYQVNELDSV